MAKMILFPVKKGIVSQPYGANKDFYKQKFNIDGGHNGVDIVSFHGDTIMAAEDGLIFKTYDSTNGSVTKGFGVYLLGNPDEQGICNAWVYWHTMSNLAVKKGDLVKQGDPLAFEGDSGAVYVNMQPVPDSEKGKLPYPGTHVHWGKIKCLKTLNPVSRVLSTATGTPYVDSQGYQYQALNADNGNLGYIDPFGDGDVVEYDVWLAQQMAEESAHIVNQISTADVPVQQKKDWLQSLYDIWVAFLKYIQK